MNETYTYLSNFQKTLPPNRFAQGDLISWIGYCHAQAEKLKPDTTYTEKDYALMSKLFERYAVKATQISQRYLETNDSLSSDLKTAEIYKVTDSSPTGADILERTMFFSKKADAILRECNNCVLFSSRISIICAYRLSCFKSSSIFNLLQARKDISRAANKERTNNDTIAVIIETILFNL